MEPIYIFIIVISTLLAIVFKVVMFKKIRNWMDQDLIKGLADQNPDKLKFLTEKYNEMIESKVNRKEYHQRLTDLAEQFEQNN